MEIETTNNYLTKIVADMKDRMSSKFAFTLNQALIKEVQCNAFPKPPRREPQVQEAKMELEMSTSVSSCSSKECRQLKDQSETTKRVMNIVHSFEEYLEANHIVRVEEVKQARQFHQQLMLTVLEKGEEFRGLLRDCIGISIALLNAERMGMNKVKFLEFVSETLRISKYDKLSKIRKSKPYLCLKQHLRPTACLSCF